VGPRYGESPDWSDSCCSRAWSRSALA